MAFDRIPGSLFCEGNHEFLFSSHLGAVSKGTAGLLSRREVLEGWAGGQGAQVPMGSSGRWAGEGRVPVA